MPAALKNTPTNQNTAFPVSVALFQRLARPTRSLRAKNDCSTQKFKPML